MAFEQLTDEEVIEIQSLYDSGKKQEEIVNITGKSVGTVSKYVKATRLQPTVPTPIIKSCPNCKTSLDIPVGASRVECPSCNKQFDVEVEITEPADWLMVFLKQYNINISFIQAQCDRVRLCNELPHPTDLFIDLKEMESGITNLELISRIADVYSTQVKQHTIEIDTQANKKDILNDTSILQFFNDRGLVDYMEDEMEKGKTKQREESPEYEQIRNLFTSINEMLSISSVKYPELREAEQEWENAFHYMECTSHIISINDLTLLDSLQRRIASQIYSNRVINQENQIIKHAIEGSCLKNFIEKKNIDLNEMCHIGKIPLLRSEISLFSAEEIEHMKKRINPEGDLIYCIKRKKWIRLIPEEIVRQLWLPRLLSYGVPIVDIDAEYEIQMASTPKYIDIAIKKKDEVKIAFELKAPGTSKSKSKMETGRKQLWSYCAISSASYGVLSDGRRLYIYKNEDKKPNRIDINIDKIIEEVSNEKKTEIKKTNTDMKLQDKKDKALVKLVSGYKQRTTDKMKNTYLHSMSAQQLLQEAGMSEDGFISYMKELEGE